jgi:hypothetical protein
MDGGVEVGMLHGDLLGLEVEVKSGSTSFVTAAVVDDVLGRTVTMEGVICLGITVHF